VSAQAKPTSDVVDADDDVRRRVKVRGLGRRRFVISKPALFAARVRIACPSFVDVDEVVLGSA
jgi:hypothetical protein